MTTTASWTIEQATKAVERERVGAEAVVAAEMAVVAVAVAVGAVAVGKYSPHRNRHRHSCMRNCCTLNRI